jgi:tetratricopeptide (TPR) repeat protein
MHSFTKIILIILLFCLLISAGWNFNFRVLLADYYYQRVVSTSDWPQILNFYNKIFYYQPLELYYQQTFASDLKWNSQFYQNNKFKIKIIGLAIDRINQISINERFLGTKERLVELYALKASLTQNKSDFLKAESEVEQLVAIFPQVARLYDIWCQLKIYQSDWSGAKQKCEQALSLYPPLNHPQMNPEHRDMIKAEMKLVYEKLGDIYVSLKNYEMAEDFYIQTLKIFPLSQPYLWKKIGDTYYLRGDIDGAIKRNYHGHILMPNDSFWFKTLSSLYRAKGDIIQADFWSSFLMDSISK